MKFNKNIISEKEIELYGKTYNEITFDDGETILKRYHHKYEMWTVLRFSQNCSNEKLELIKNELRKLFIR